MSNSSIENDWKSGIDPSSPIAALFGIGDWEGVTSIKPGGLLLAGQEIRLPPTIALKSATDLGPLIRKSRKAMKFSQQQFADAAGVGRRFLSELENGKPSLEFDKVIACALAAGIDILAKPRLPL